MVIDTDPAINTYFPAHSIKIHPTNLVQAADAVKAVMMLGVEDAGPGWFETSPGF